MMRAMPETRPRYRYMMNIQMTTRAKAISAANALLRLKALPSEGPTTSSEIATSLTGSDPLLSNSASLLACTAVNPPLMTPWPSVIAVSTVGLIKTLPVSYTHLRAHETRHDLVCRLLLEKKKKKT